MMRLLCSHTVPAPAAAASAAPAPVTQLALLLLFVANAEAGFAAAAHAHACVHVGRAQLPREAPGAINQMYAVVVLSKIKKASRRLDIRRSVHKSVTRDPAMVSPFSNESVFLGWFHLSWPVLRVQKSVP